MIKIKLQWKYLKHDIDQWTWRLADTRIQDAEQKNSAQSSDDESDVTFFIRKIGEAIAEVKEKYYQVIPNIIQTISKTEFDDTIDKNTVAWEVEFNLSEKSYVDSDNLSKLMHKYVVSRVIYWWSLIYAPDASAGLSSDSDLNQISVLLKTKKPTLS